MVGDDFKGDIGFKEGTEIGSEFLNGEILQRLYKAAIAEQQHPV
jgi:hypothetical protein